ncbi:MAG TPA: aa3-type cytochrome c oxidase subunit IV [Stellaceae bacterium]|nr:aa3-type cytochrome c oxidase subunit IV [Stellaceae bacterium]
MAMTMTDPEFERHRQTWIGFTRLLRWTVAIIIIVLVGMAIFLL